jgi:hypothetical protein
MRESTEISWSLRKEYKEGIECKSSKREWKRERKGKRGRERMEWDEWNGMYSREVQRRKRK